MEDTSTPQITTTNTPNLLINSLGRAFLTLILLIASIACVAFALYYAFGTITCLPGLLYRSFDTPFVSLITTIAYILTILTTISLGASLFILGYRLIKRHSITHWYLTTCIILAVLSLILIFGIAPNFSNFTGAAAFPRVLPEYLAPSSSFLPF